MPQSTTINIAEASITLREDGIIHIIYNEGVIIDVQVQHNVQEVFDKLAAGKKRPYLFEAMDNCSVTKEARENAIKMEDKVLASAYAVVANSIAYRLIANFYLKVNKPKSPYRVFNTEQAATKWLLKFV